MFPHVEPIPLPAPIWLFKVLEILTVTLHFLAVQLLLGGLLIGAMWALWGRWRQRANMVDAAGQVSGWLPILMLYVINLGVPPLLFAQLLYGRAIYTSSILIGVFWISVVLLLMVVYTLLYVMAGWARAGRQWGWIGLLALIVAAKIALIYTSNMSLMIRPQAWVAMYRADPLGVHLNSGDPTVWPRWLFMVVGGGLGTGGVGLMLIGMGKTLRADTARLLRLSGARLAMVGIVVQVALGYWVLAVQPADVQTALAAHGLYGVLPWIWLLLALLVLVTALIVHNTASTPNGRWIGLAGGLVFLETAAMAIERGGVRDVALGAHGLNVWDRHVATNWPVVVTFVVLFVFGLAVLAWLGTVVARARKVEEHYV